MLYCTSLLKKIEMSSPASKNVIWRPNFFPLAHSLCLQDLSSWQGVRPVPWHWKAPNPKPWPPGNSQGVLSFHYNFKGFLEALRTHTHAHTHTHTLKYTWDTWCQYRKTHNDKCLFTHVHTCAHAYMHAHLLEHMQIQSPHAHSAFPCLMTPVVLNIHSLPSRSCEALLTQKFFVFLHSPLRPIHEQYSGVSCWPIEVRRVKKPWLLEIFNTGKWQKSASPRNWGVTTF